MESIARKKLLEGKGKRVRIPSCLEGFVGSWRVLKALEATVRTRHKRQITIWVSSWSERLLWKQKNIGNGCFFEKCTRRLADVVRKLEL
jgi:hypothetical protein